MKAQRSIALGTLILFGLGVSLAVSRRTTRASCIGFSMLAMACHLAAENRLARRLDFIRAPRFARSSHRESPAGPFEPVSDTASIRKRLVSSSHVSLPRKGCRVGLRIVEACSAFTRVTACQSPGPRARGQ
jgi:hypothetical protein